MLHGKDSSGYVLLPLHTHTNTHTLLPWEGQATLKPHPSTQIYPSHTMSCSHTHKTRKAPPAKEELNGMQPAHMTHDIIWLMTHVQPPLLPQGEPSYGKFDDPSEPLMGVLYYPTWPSVLSWVYSASPHRGQWGTQSPLWPLISHHSIIHSLCSHEIRKYWGKWLEAWSHLTSSQWNVEKLTNKATWCHLVHWPGVGADKLLASNPNDSLHDPRLQLQTPSSIILTLSFGKKAISEPWFL